ncbi:hypothetical protein [Methylobacterium fujisawaense]|jgi:hypothetical protein
MLALQVQTVVDTPSGLPLRFPIGVPDRDLTAFAERLTREGGLMVTKLRLRRENGVAYVTAMERMFLGLAGVATIRDHDVPVRLEVDEVAA